MPEAMAESAARVSRGRCTSDRTVGGRRGAGDMGQVLGLLSCLPFTLGEVHLGPAFGVSILRVSTNHLKHEADVTRVLNSGFTSQYKVTIQPLPRSSFSVNFWSLFRWSIQDGRGPSRRQPGRLRSCGPGSLHAREPTALVCHAARAPGV